MRIAALYDVHGNLPALEAVLAEVAEEAVDAVVFGGDLVWGPWPAESLERARALGGRAQFLRGNTERLVLEGAGEHVWALDRLSHEQRAFVATWEPTLSLDVDGLGRVLFCHATPRNDEEMLTPASPPARWVEALASVQERCVVVGHTHLQFDWSFEGVRIVNPGSVGAPTVRAVAWWALLGPDVELRTTGYDTVAAVEAARADRVPHAERFARWLLDPPAFEERAAP